MKKLIALLLIALGTYAAGAGSDPNIEKTFDRYKGSIYALYARALRENAQLRGEIVVNFDIATTGDVTDCRVKSSTLGSPDLERKICERVRLMKFSPRPSAFTATKRIDFFPA
jgi:periplasmic protein TonB